MESENQCIKCSAFQNTEGIIKKAETKIRDSGIIKEKQYYAQDILLEAEVLLSCSNYNNNDPDCSNCRFALFEYIQEYKHSAEDEIKKPLVT